MFFNFHAKVKKCHISFSEKLPKWHFFTRGHSDPDLSSVNHITILPSLCQNEQKKISFSFAFLRSNSHTKSDPFSSRYNFKSNNKSLCIHIVPGVGVSKSDQIGLCGMYTINCFRDFLTFSILTLGSRAESINFSTSIMTVNSSYYFQTFVIAGPAVAEENSQNSGSAIGDCVTDSFSVTSGGGGRGSPIICGINTAQHGEYL